MQLKKSISGRSMAIEEKNQSEPEIKDFHHFDYVMTSSFILTQRLKIT